MIQKVKPLSQLLTKEEFADVVNRALCDDGQPPETDQEIDAIYFLYRRLYKEDGGGELSFERVAGRLEPVIGCP